MKINDINVAYKLICGIELVDYTNILVKNSYFYINNQILKK